MSLSQTQKQNVKLYYSITGATERKKEIETSRNVFGTDWLVWCVYLYHHTI